MASKKRLLPAPQQTINPDELFARLDALQPAVDQTQTTEPRGTMRAIGDTAVQFGKGAVTGVRMMSDVFGADNAVSGGLRSADDALNGLLSATAKQDQAQVAAIMQEAEGKGWMEQIGMGLRAAGVAPGALLAQAAGTAVPTLAAAAMTGGAGPMATAARFAAPAVMGGIQGMGATKGAIYETTKQELLKAGASPEEAEARAVEQQAYGGDSSGQIALGTGLGVVAGGLGIERAMAGLRGGVAKAAPGMMTRMGTGAVTEAVPEFAQGGQEKYATNSALNNEGFQVDPMSGVVANATMEGVAGAGMGAAFGIPRPDVAQQQPAPVAQPAPPPGPMQRAAAAGMPSNFTATPAATLGAQTPVNAGAGFNAGNLPNGMGAPAQIMDQAELDALVESDRRDQQVMLAQMDMERQKQAEIDAAFEAKPALDAQQRAAELGAPSVMAQAFQRAQTPAEQPAAAEQVPVAPVESAAQVPEPRIVERTPDMPAPMPRELAELQVDMDGGEVVRTQNRNGKWAYHVVKQAPTPPSAQPEAPPATDILNKLGKPFTNLFAAKTEAGRRGAGFEPVKVGEGAYVVRQVSQPINQGASDGNQNAQTSQAPEALLTGADPQPTEPTLEPQAPQTQPQQTQREEAPKAFDQLPDLTPGQREVLDPAIARDLEKQYQQDLVTELKRKRGLLPEQKDDELKRSPFKTFLITHGVSDRPADVVGEGNAFRANNIIPTLFRKNGIGMDELVNRAAEAGFITQEEADNGEGVPKLAEMIRSEVAGTKRHLPLDMQDESAEQRAEQNLRFEVEADAQELGLVYDPDMDTRRLQGMVMRVRDRVKRAPKNGLLKPDRILRNARDAATRIEQKRAQLEAQSKAFADLNDEIQNAVLDVFVDADGNTTEFMRTTDAQAVEQWFKDNPTWNQDNDTTDASANRDSQQTGTPEPARPAEGAGRDQATGPGAQQGSAQGQSQEGLTAPTRADVLAQQAALEAEEQRKKDGGDKPIQRKVTADQVDLFNPQGSIFDAPAEPAQPAAASQVTEPPVSKTETTERFAIGKSLTKEQRKKVLATLTDVYKAKGAPKESKGQGRDGEERYGYAYSPDLFEKSDITGAMVRYHVTLPDGKLAHPSELFEGYTQSDIDAELERRSNAEKRNKQTAREQYLEPSVQFDTKREASAYWNDKSDKSTKTAQGKPTIFDALDREFLTDGKKFVMVPRDLLANTEMMDAIRGEGWDVPTAKAEQPAQPAGKYQGPSDVSTRAGQMELANRAGRIASLKAMNGQLRQIAPNEAWADANIESANDLDALQDQISAALVAAGKGTAATAKAPDALRAELEEMSGAELRAIFEAMNLAGKNLMHSERVDMLMAEDAAEVRAAIAKAQPAAQEPAKPAGNTMFSRKAQAPADIKNLVTLHNLNADNLLYSNSIGGIPVPSIGITKVDSAFGGFGDITLIAPKGMIDPSNGTPVYDRDAYTSRHPTLNYKKVKAAKADAFYNRIVKVRELGFDGGFVTQVWDAIKNASTQNPDKVWNIFQGNDAPRLLYVSEVLGKSVKIPMKSVSLDFPWAADKEFSKKLADLADEAYADYRTGLLDDSPKLKELSDAARKAIERYVDKYSTESDPELRKDLIESMAVSWGSSGKWATDPDAIMPWKNVDKLKASVRDFGKTEVDKTELSKRLDKLVKSSDEAYADWALGIIKPLFEPPTITLRGKEVEPTLQNVVEAMTTGATAGAEKTMTSGPGKIAALLGKRFKSLAQIQAARDQVVPEAAETEAKKSTDAILDAYRTRALNFYVEKDWRGQVDTWGAMDASMEALAAAGKLGTGDGAIRMALARKGFKSVDQTTVDLARQAIDAIRSTVTNYFEAKPQRAVKLNEFRAAVVPKGTSKEVLDVLAANGIQVATYNKADPEAKNKALEKLARKVDKEHGDVLFSRGTIPAGLPIRQVTSIVRAITERWSNAPQIIVATNMADPQIPQAVRDYDQKQKSLGATGEPEGFVYGGKVYLLAEQLATPTDVMRVLFHESLGHMGLRGVFGDKLNGILKQLAAFRRKDVAAKAAQYGLDMSVEADRLHAAEEVLAELAQSRPEIGFVKRAVAAIRTWLRENVPGFSDLNLSDDEIVRSFILPARNWVERRQSAKLGDAGPAAVQRGGDRALWDAKKLTDILEGAAFREKGLRGLEIPQQRVVLSIVARAIHNRKVFDGVVQLVPVDVMNNLTGQEGSSNGLLDDPAMFQNLAIINSDNSVPKVVDEASALVRATAFVAAKQLGRSGQRGFPAGFIPTMEAFKTQLAASMSADAGIAAKGKATLANMIGLAGKRFSATGAGKIQDRHVVTPTSDGVLGAGDVGASSVPPILSGTGENTSFFSRGSDAVRPGDVYRSENGWAITVMRTFPGGNAEVRMQGKGLRLSTFKTGELKAMQKIGRADYLDGAYSTPQSLIDLAKNEPTAPDSGGATRFSRTKIVGETSRQHTPEQLRAMKNVGFQVEVPTLKERAQAIWKDAGKKLAQGIADQFAPIKDMDTKAYGLMRLAKGASGAFESLLHGGLLKLSDNVYDFDETKRGGVIDKLLMPLQGEHHDFMRWVAANRAERLMGDGKEHLFSPQDIADLKTLATGQAAFDYTIQNGIRAGRTTRDRAEIYRDSLVTFNTFNKNVLDMAEQSGMIDAASRAVWEHEFYVPFYRVADDSDGGVRGMNIKGGVVRQQAFKQLKGGKNALNADLLDNTLMNWAHLLDASAKNRAAKATIEAAERLGVAIGGNQTTLAQMGSSVNNKNGVVWFMDGGVKRYSLIDNQGDGAYLMTAITALEYAGMRSPIMNAMGFMKNALTIGVTASPFFKIRNLIRDSVTVIGTSGINVSPLANVAQGWKMTSPKNDAYFRLLAGGGTIHFGTMLEGSEAKRVQALVESGVDAGTILNNDHKVKAFYRKFIEPGITAYNELGNRGETVNRASLYAQLVSQGMTHAEASLQARDLMDFSMQGSFTSIRFLSQVVPFFNARIQGMYKLGRAAKEDPARFSAVVGAAAVISLGLLAAYSDDDDWKKREDWDRNNFWWFKFGGVAFRIPKPFEIGAIATLAERGFELAFEKEMTATAFRKQVMTLLGDNLSMNPIPQIVKPIIDVYANKNSFSGNPIESMSMERLKSEYRFNDRTSMTARGLSTAANSVTGLVGVETLSPVQIDHMLRGYFGWLGTFIVGAGDKLARPATSQTEQAAPDYWKTATGGMISDLRDAPSKYVSNMYEQARVIEQAYGTWRSLVKQGDRQGAAEFAADNQELIGKHRQVEAIKRTASKLNERVRQIERSDMSAQEKRDQIRRIRNQQELIAKRLAPL